MDCYLEEMHTSKRRRNTRTEKKQDDLDFFPCLSSVAGVVSSSCCFSTIDTFMNGMMQLQQPVTSVSRIWGTPPPTRRGACVRPCVSTRARSRRLHTRHNSILLIILLSSRTPRTESVGSFDVSKLMSSSRRNYSSFLNFGKKTRFERYTNGVFLHSFILPFINDIEISLVRMINRRIVLIIYHI